jgi:hypothetical protein
VGAKIIVIVEYQDPGIGLLLTEGVRGAQTADTCAYNDQVVVTLFSRNITPVFLAFTAKRGGQEG